MVGRKQLRKTHLFFKEGDGGKKRASQNPLVPKGGGWWEEKQVRKTHLFLKEGDGRNHLLLGADDVETQIQIQTTIYSTVLLLLL